jgi:hypothetical protein
MQEGDTAMGDHGNGSDPDLPELLDFAGVMATCGTLIHFVFSEQDLTERFVRYVQPQFAGEGDAAEAEKVLGFLAHIHEVASPGCPDQLGPERKEAGS